MRLDWRVTALWCCFLARLGFYATALPLWEGWDEWAHFAVVRAMATRGELLPSRDRAVPRDVEESLRIVPMPWEFQGLPAPSLTHDAFWQLPPAERAARVAALTAMPGEWRRQDGSGAFKAYEALQPPLYYWLTTPLLWAAAGLSLAAQVLLLRWAAVLVASLAVPLVFLVAREIFRDGRVALGCASIVALMPGFALDVARVGNDCLAVVLFTALIWLALRGERRAEWVAGIVLGLGLLTKAYFLTAVPALLVARKWRAVAVAIPIAGWWYLRNVLTTGTFSGLSESVMLRGEGTLGMLGRAADVPWRTAIDSILFSHLYFGGWSGLTVRSWMYHVFYGVVLLAVAGLCRGAWRDRALRIAMAFYAAFWLGQLYNVMLIFVSKGVATSMGWYLFAVVSAQVVLCVAGLRALLPEGARDWAVRTGVVLFAALDLYTLHAVAIPYYTGMIRHRANGSLAAVHGADFAAIGLGGAMERLAVFKTEPGVVAALCTASLLATGVVVVLGIKAARSAPIKGARIR